MRHAKSSWADANVQDHDRPLNRRGLRDAPRMGSWIADQELIPDSVISSTALRARTTAELVIEHCDGIACELELEPDFYHAPPAAYTGRMRMLDEQIDRVMFVGHNPGMEQLVSMLSGTWERMPTAALAIFELQIDSWADQYYEDQVAMLELWRPKELFQA